MGESSGKADCGFKAEEWNLALSVQKDRGRKKMLTKAKSLAFSPSLADALLSITVLALNSCESQHLPFRQVCKIGRPEKATASLKVFVDASFRLKYSR